MAGKPKALGKGLSAIFGSDQIKAELTRERSVELNLDQLTPNPYQPRRVFDEEKLSELAESIKAHGVLQPIVVRQHNEVFQIIAGERRWRAARLAGLSTIPATIKQLDDATMMQVALIENLQRQDLNAIEEAQAYRSLMDEFGMTQEELSATVGRSRPAIANTVRLLNLPEQVQQYVADGRITGGHARCLLSLSNQAVQARVAERIVSLGLNVRQTEQLAKNLNSNVSRETKRRGNEIADDPDALRLAGRLSERLGTKVRVSGSASKGVLQIDYHSAEDLDRILEIILGVALSAES